MKKFLVFSFFVSAFVFVTSSNILAQDPAKVGPEIYKSLFENERIRVFEITFEAGEEIGAHSHPDHMVYVLTDGKLKIMEEGKEPMEADLKTGQVLYLPAQTHSAVNLGQTELKAIVVELKD
jgi:quercetin dioxygenase-like cupin family protein